ncbi:MAG TPA: NTP transferase domain-containing protein [Terriglobales bacterium]|nr:NTP transferase domain-containing protein [Terriglobales bacterium]
MAGKVNNSGVAAVILAAGKSTRMGEPKQLLKIGGKALLETAMESALASQADEVVVVLGFAAEAVSQFLPAGVKKVINENYEQGMGTSLRAGLGAVRPGAGAALIILADQPFVKPETLDRLMEQHRNSGAQIVIPTYRGFRGNPVLLDRSVFPEVMALGGDVGCRAIFGSHSEGIVKVEVHDVGVLIDVDTKDDLQQLNAAGAGAELFELADLEGRGETSEAASARPELVITGRDDLARALAELGKFMGFAVTVADPLLDREDVPQADRILRVLDFSRLPPGGERYAIVASRGRFDEEAVEQALLTGCAYVGLVANRKRAEEVLNSLRKKGIRPEKLAQVHAPAGVEIGAKTPEEVALSIMAEMVKQMRQRG